MLPLHTRLHRRLELVDELGELVAADVTDGPEVQAAFAPAAAVEALHGLSLRRPMLGARGLRYEQVDHVLSTLVDDGADGACIDIVEPAADQRETSRGGIDHRWGDVEL